jgi:hypothetical protein
MRKQILSVTVAIVLMATVSFAQRGGPVGMAGGLQQAYEQIKGNLTQAAEAVPESGWGFKPSTLEDTRTYGQVIGHVANAQFFQCSGPSGMANPNQGNDLEDAARTRAEVIKGLADSFAFCDKAFGMLTDANAMEGVSGGRGGPSPRALLLMNVVAHSNEMYGTAAVYLRAQNIVPPSTANRGRGRGGRGGRGN